MICSGGGGALEERTGQRLEGFGQQGVVGVGEGAGDDGPGQSSQRAPSSSRRMRMSSATASAGWVSLSWMATLSGKAWISLVGLVAADDVVEEQATKKVLLLEAQFAALLDVVVGVEHLGDVLGDGLGLVGLHVVAVVEEGQVEVLGGRASQRRRLLTVWLP
jgi:hypothetical protein